MSQLVNAEVNSGNHIKSGTRIKLRYKDSWTPSRIAGMHYGDFAYVNSLGVLCQNLISCMISPNLPRFRGPRIEALKYIKQHLYSGEILFHVETQVFEKAKSLNQVKINSDELRQYVSQDI